MPSVRVACGLEALELVPLVQELGPCDARVDAARHVPPLQPVKLVEAGQC